MISNFDQNLGKLCSQSIHLYFLISLEFIINYKIFFLDGYSNQYWCWSRRDVSEETIKDAILSTAVVDDYEMTELSKNPFSVRYLSNGTHYKCDHSEEWANAWYTVTDYNTSPCITNTSLAVNVKFKPAADNKL